MKEFASDTHDLDDMIARVPGVDAYAGRAAWGLLRNTAATAVDQSPSSECDVAAVEAHVSLELDEITRAGEWAERFYPR